MLVFRCNKCGHLAEVNAGKPGDSFSCPACQTVGTLYSTIPYIRKLLEHFFTQKKQLATLQAQFKTNEAALAAASSEIASLKARLVAPPAAAPLPVPETLTAEAQELLIQNWFLERLARVEFCPESEESTEYFAQMAEELGQSFAQLCDVSNTIRTAQQKGLIATGLSLAQKHPKLVTQINVFCQKLFAHAFISRYAFQQEEKVVRLGIQKSPEVQRFFDGEWLQWFVFTRVLHQLEARKCRFAATRQLGFAFLTQELQMLDTFFLIEDKPLCIQCSADANAPGIAAALELRQQLELKPETFALCVAGLDNATAAQLSQQHGLTVINETGLPPVIARLLPA